MAETAAVACETCRISATRYRSRPCALCFATERDDLSVAHLAGPCMCEHCGTVIVKISRVRFGGKNMVVGTTCANKLVEEGGVRIYG